MEKCIKCKIEGKGFKKVIEKDVLKHYCKSCWIPVSKKIQERKMIEKRKKAREAKKETVSYLTKELDKVFSVYIRTRDMDKNGFVSCIDCGKKNHWTKVDCGHFQPRSCMNTRWNEMNCQSQLKSCNGPRGQGRQWLFGQALNLKYGEGTADYLVTEAEKPKKWTSEELKMLILYYQDLTKFINA